ncbi:hypothetical protein CLAFUW4_09353 [Fulvia fulva]|uniref:Asl1-like glycosyl hydrolase catalytic domain-containing protein n=1 Tax=Passalora fulva TaxID=5499 RepID=A0A9Q8PH81_PASFU|nr:uncharacterized protein CLAFUR5_09453 [Fulvia fulva]KAK4613403.1 hypothetical protein CLAFUR4_09359 [Fulvia fulva]KAK4614900.1 hypothetical protein CLAFUR0_09351 [Fulvia fulva]UJO22370.1 hypothetical protein CLAFUR5_09453 [Fulvia fulva]WPV20636.1 hypothetical protein CLAFUW4_09353 [Fulvia fulva]WPV35385.1 hypothetical protein CLAFUW7_09354 [Fulvia fulva]
MSAITQFTVLAFASTALARQYQHGHLHGRHQRLYDRSVGTGSGAPYGYPTANSTGIWGTTGCKSATGVEAAAVPTAYGPAGGNTYTLSNIHTEVVYSTISMNYPASSAAEQCAADVTVTNTEKVYVTVTAGHSASSSAEVSAVESTYAAPAYSALASSSDEVSPVASSSAGGHSAPAYSSASSGSSTYNADTTSAAQYSSSPGPATSAAALPTSYAAASSQNTGSATASAPASYGSSSSSSGKRGLAYNDASLTTCFDGSSEISWAYNWESDAKGLSGGLSYIPTLWGNADTYTSSWSSNAKSAIASGSTHLFSFNEPDLTAQANMDAATAAEAYKQYMNPFNGQAKLCAPSVTNGPDPMGLSWLSNFLAACDGGCKIDCINIHWYDSATNIDYFKEHLENATSIATKYNIDTLYLSEFGATGSDDQVNTFLETVMPWMDSNDAVGGYAYYMVANGMLVSGGEPTTYGSTYKSYTSS